MRDWGTSLLSMRSSNHTRCMRCKGRGGKGEEEGRVRGGGGKGEKEGERDVYLSKRLPSIAGIAPSRYPGSADPRAGARFPLA